MINGQSVNSSVTAFLRSGIYAETYNDNTSDPFSSVYGDAGVKVDIRNDFNFRAYADVRYRYGSEFRKGVSEVHLREGWISLYYRRIDFIIGQRIIKWGRADFDNPTSSFNPRNLIVRSPEREDMDLGNISASVVYKPFPFLSLQGIVTPFYRPDVLITSPLSLPEGVTINEINGLHGGESMAGYGVKGDLFLGGFDFSVSYFNGNDPLPGIALSSVAFDIGEDGVEIASVMSVTPYRISRAGFDFETVAGRFGLRGEGSWTKPELSFRDNEYVPMPEMKWAAGADVTIGSFMIGAEYIGKYITDYEPSPVEPLLPGEMPAMTPEQIGMIPGGLEGYVALQTAAFNRLYMYQIEESYHSAGLRVEADLAAGIITPSIFALYNFTTGDLAMVPSLKYKPADGITLLVGADIYKGREGSLYDIIDNPLTNVYMAIRVDF